MNKEQMINRLAEYTEEKVTNYKRKREMYVTVP